MKKVIVLIVVCLVVKIGFSQDDKQKVERACLDYIEGFYEGDTAKLIKCLKPTLYKIGFWKNKTSGNYDPDGQMTYRQALDFAKNALEKKNFANQVPKKK